VKKELAEKGLERDTIERLLEIFDIKGDNESILEQLRKIIISDYGKKGIDDMQELLSYLKLTESGKIVFNHSLARGLNYYTGTVFEGFLNDSKITSSICGGGRYDNMIGMYAENNRQYPAVGLAFGLEPITDAIKLLNKEQKKTVTQLYIIPIKTFIESIAIASSLRQAGVNVDIDLMDRGVSKNLDYANAMKIPYVAIIGEQELQEKKIKLKDMHSGNERLVSLEEAYNEISKK
jgi:histidyl-tRNA synthetase